MTHGLLLAAMRRMGGIMVPALVSSRVPATTPNGRQRLEATFFCTASLRRRSIFYGEVSAFRCSDDLLAFCKRLRKEGMELLPCDGLLLVSTVAKLKGVKQDSQDFQGLLNMVEDSLIHDKGQTETAQPTGEQGRGGGRGGMIVAETSGVLCVAEPLFRAFAELKSVRGYRIVLPYLKASVQQHLSAIQLLECLWSLSLLHPKGWEAEGAGGANDTLLLWKEQVPRRLLEKLHDTKNDRQCLTTTLAYKLCYSLARLDLKEEKSTTPLLHLCSDCIISNLPKTVDFPASHCVRISWSFAQMRVKNHCLFETLADYLVERLDSLPFAELEVVERVFEAAVDVRCSRLKKEVAELKQDYAETFAFQCPQRRTDGIAGKRKKNRRAALRDDVPQPRRRSP